jgi:hypothetical protein
MNTLRTVVNTLRTVAASLILLAAAGAHADGSMRCDSALISVNDSMTTVLRKCGEPSGRGPVSYLKHANGQQREEIPVQRWTYGPTFGMYHYLRFEGDRLADITGERG